MKFKLGKKGFSLLEVVIVGGLLAGLSMASLKVFENINKGKKSLQRMSDNSSLKTEITQILSSPNFCRVSLAGNGNAGSPSSPVSFYRSTTNQLDISLYYSNSSGNQRSSKRFNGANNVLTPDKSKYGALRIESLKLKFLNTPSGCSGNYCDSTAHSDLAEIVAITSSKESKINKTHRFPIVLGLKTASGKSTIISCSREIEQMLIPKTLSSSTNCNSDNYGELRSFKGELFICDPSKKWLSSTIRDICDEFPALHRRGHSVHEKGHAAANARQICVEEMTKKHGKIDTIYRSTWEQGDHDSRKRYAYWNGSSWQLTQKYKSQSNLKYIRKYNCCVTVRKEPTF